MTIYYAIERKSAQNLMRADTEYRLTTIQGASYTETQLREWVNKVWQIPIKASLIDITKAVKEGGWILIKILTIGD